MHVRDQDKCPNNCLLDCRASLKGGECKAPFKEEDDQVNTKETSEGILTKIFRRNQGPLSEIYWKTTVIEAMEEYANLKTKALQEENEALLEALNRAKTMMERDKVGGYRIDYKGQPAHEEGCTYLVVRNAIQKSVKE